MRRSTFVCIALSTRRLKTSTQLVSVCWRLNSSTKTPVLPRSATCSAFRRVGNIAGCYITEGEISRDDKVRVVRDSKVIYEGKISSLRRFKDDVKSVKQGYECGIGVDGYQDIKVGDVIEGYRTEEVERTE